MLDPLEWEARAAGDARIIEEGERSRRAVIAATGPVVLEPPEVAQATDVVRYWGMQDFRSLPAEELD